MTKVLIISNKSDITTDFIVKELKRRDINFYRLNTEELTKTCFVTLDFGSNLFLIKDTVLNVEVNLKHISSVYYRRPELPLIDNSELSAGEETFLKNEITYCLEGIYKILRDAYWISPLFAIRQAENKIYQLDIAKSIGFIIPDSIITNDYDKLNYFRERNNHECIIKPIRSGLISDESESKVIFTNTLSGLSFTKAEFEMSPNYIQQHIRKRGDIRVTMVGNKAYATLIHSQIDVKTKTDWRKGESELKHSKIKLPDLLKQKCDELMTGLNLRFGAIDFILNETGEYVFLEINPNGQWAWIERKTGYKISEEIVNLLVYENY